MIYAPWRQKPTRRHSLEVNLNEFRLAVYVDPLHFILYNRILSTEIVDRQIQL